ncbi:hypothetical protein [Streptomyces sp. NPDC099088]|uniref:hypothetical protein n=1 Tax=Streptomyces sp. NPDC099088 TaxID=3366101 RepID=UPI00381FED06
MPEVQAPTTELATQYVTQVAADLDRNAKEQARVRSELDALQEQLHALQHDHDVLVNIRQALSGSGSANSTTLRRPAPGHRRSKVKKASTGTSTTATPKESTAKPPHATSARNAQPSLVNLVRNHLKQTSEPLSAAEITGALAQAHPNRSIKTAVVRTTVENLVAKSQAQRSKQGSSVFYTAAASETSQLAVAAAS